MDYPAIDARLRGLVKGFIWKVADNAIDQEDLVQAAWLRGLPGLRRNHFPSDRHRAQYLFAIARNIAIDRHRHRTAFPTFPLGDWVPGGTSVEDEAILNAMAEDACKVAPAPTIAYGLGYSIEEVGAMFGVHPNTIKTRSFRWRKANVTQPQLGG